MVLLCTGCASIVSGTRQKITVNSTPSGAKLSVIDSDGATVLQTNTPAVIKLNRGKGYFAGGYYKVQMEADGYAPSAANIHPTLNGWYVGNVLFGGIIGLLFVDPATGAMWALEPATVNVTLEALPGKAAVLGTTQP
jgi:hypothetical protein